jgi:hypothetical protein
MRQRRLKKRNVLMACLLGCRDLLSTSKILILTALAFFTFITGLVTLANTMHDPKVDPQDRTAQITRVLKAARSLGKRFKEVFGMGNTTGDWTSVTRKIKGILEKWPVDEPGFGLSEKK